MPRPRLYPSSAARQRAFRAKKRRDAVAPHVLCRQIGSHCMVYCSDWQTVSALLPHQAAIVTDPPYLTTYDYTKTRRHPSQWARNFVGADQPFDPTPWLRFPEVILFGADHYRKSLPPGAWICWDKLAGTTPADFAPAEWAWTSLDIPPQFFPHLWRGGMRAGEENISRQGDKYHPAQKPLSVMQRCVRLITPGLVIIDPFMGSGTTLAACMRLGRPCIGIEIDEQHYAVACDRLQQEVEALGLFA